MGFRNCNCEMISRQSGLEDDFCHCKVWNHNLSIKMLRGEKGKCKI